MAQATVTSVCLVAFENGHGCSECQQLTCIANGLACNIVNDKLAILMAAFLGLSIWHCNEFDNRFMQSSMDIIKSSRYPLYRVDAIPGSSALQGSPTTTTALIIIVTHHDLHQKCHHTVLHVLYYTVQCIRGFCYGNSKNCILLPETCSTPHAEGTLRLPAAEALQMLGQTYHRCQLLRST